MYVLTSSRIMMVSFYEVVNLVSEKVEVKVGVLHEVQSRREPGRRGCLFN